MPAKTRSNSSSRRAAARTWRWTPCTEPASAGSVTSTPRVAPIASPLRIVSGAFVGAIVSNVTSPSPAASMSFSAASSTYSSLPLMTAGEGSAVQATVRAKPLPG